MTPSLFQRRIAGSPGTYAVLLCCHRPTRLRIGRLGVLRARRGSYLYVGSALGPGGVRARVRHHERRSERPRWHIDHLRAGTELVEVWYSHDTLRREHQWATIVSRLDGARAAMAGFGSSDCRCATHLFFFENRPSVKVFRGRLRRTTQGHAPVRSLRVARTASAASRAWGRQDGLGGRRSPRTNRPAAPSSLCVPPGHL